MSIVPEGLESHRNYLTSIERFMDIFAQVNENL